MNLLTLIVVLPLTGFLLNGLLGPRLGKSFVTVVGCGLPVLAFLATIRAFGQLDGAAGLALVESAYTWAVVGDFSFDIAFYFDRLSALMTLIVTGVGSLIHIYSTGYMKDDPSYARYFAYLNLFLFFMLLLVLGRSLLVCFVGWEGVGLASYLLIGFWFEDPAKAAAGKKAFITNRVGDAGFLLGMFLIYYALGTLDFDAVNAAFQGPVPPAVSASLVGVLLFIGATGKSAQIPLHVWLPDAMAGPTPVSALIHAATMVTAGIFMVARMSPLYELSDTALGFIMVIGAITALFMGFLGMVQNDIKRVVAYSTLSQLGYMTVALGASAYSVAVFHLMTHAFFKALLFLAAGSVIIAVHHNQDIRYMGGLKKYMPITWITSLIGSLALIGTPFLSGFYSKESIIEAVKISHLPAAHLAYWAVLIGVFVTAFYSFRMYFLVFHGKERFHQGHAHGNEDDVHHDAHHGGTPHETPWVITGPLLALALPSLAIGYMTIEPMLFGDFFGSAIYVADRHPVMHELNQEFHGAVAMGLHAITTLPFWLAAAGVGLSAFFYLRRPDIPAAIQKRFAFVYSMLINKYWFDELYSAIFASGARLLGGTLWRRGDQNIIDGLVVNGSAHLVERFSRLVKAFQSGYIYHYAFAMLIGVFALVTWFARLN